MTTKHKVYITHSSSVSCAGNNNDELFTNICEGKTGIKQDKNFFFDALPAIGKLPSSLDFSKALVQQCQNILDQSDLIDFSNTLLIVGSSVGGMRLSEETYLQENSYQNINPNQHHINSIVNTLKTSFAFSDDISFSTACTSSANALGYAYEVLSKGVYQNVLVIGADSLCQTTVGGFLSLGVLSSNPSNPFDSKRDGMNVAEGIACLLLQNEPEDTIKPIELCGVGYSSDAYHMTHPHPNGTGAINAMQMALKKADITADKIDYINAHGTGTQANDEAEAKAIETLFEHKPLVSSSKSITGHTLGAAGALEAIISCYVINKQTVPKNTGLCEAENKTVNFSSHTQEKKIEYVMSNSFAFGGNNCSLIFRQVS